MDIREKLVELICKGTVYDRNLDRSRPYGCHGYTADVLADFLLANGVTVQEWIPVSEPPKEDGRYYVYVVKHDVSYVKIATFSKKSVGGLPANVWHDYDSDDGFYEVKKITHWMPLPQPPKGE